MPTDILELPHIERKRDYFLWCDFFEIRCVLSADKEATITILDEFLNPDRGLYTDSVLDDDSDDIADEEGDEDEITKFSNGVISNHYASIVESLESRELMFAEMYPFRLKKNTQTLIVKNALSQANYFYLFMLFAGNLRLLPSDRRAIFTKDFERVGSDALSKLFPGKWQYGHFGTACHPNMKTFRGRKVEKLKELAKDLKAGFICHEGDFAPTDAGDAGLDFVCWFPFERDEAPHIPVAFAQSGCTADTTEISNKQHSVSRGRLTNIFHNMRCLEFYVTPECYRNSSGNWHNSIEITSVFIDRYRIMSLIKDSIACYDSLNSVQYVHELIG